MARPSTASRVPSPTENTRAAAVADHEDGDFAELPAEASSANVPVVAKAREQNLAPASADVDAPRAALPTTGLTHLVGAIADVMNEIEVVRKAGRNKFHDYNYAKMEDILQELAPLMGKHGIVIVQTEKSRLMFDSDNAISISYEFTIMHKSGEVYPDRPVQTGLSSCRTSNGKFDDKALNKCHTSARKYFLLALFQIATGDVDDADSGGSRKREVPSSGAKDAPKGPRQISTKQTTFPVWADSYIAGFETATTVDEMNEWDTLNAAALDVIYEKESDIYDRILQAFEKHKATLAKPAASKERGASRPSTAGGKVPSPGKSAKAAASDAPDSKGDPDVFLKWADEQMATAKDADALEKMFNEQIEPVAKGLVPPDYDDLIGRYNKSMERFEG